VEVTSPAISANGASVRSGCGTMRRRAGAILEVSSVYIVRPELGGMWGWQRGIGALASARPNCAGNPRADLAAGSVSQKSARDTPEGELDGLTQAAARSWCVSMDSRGHEQLDIHEMERRVAAALIELVDDPRERHRITPKLLAARSKLPLRQVREVTDEWNLQTLSGDEYWLSPGSVEHARTRAEFCSRAEAPASPELDRVRALDPA
jgi:hypothetical protein